MKIIIVLATLLISCDYYRGLAPYDLVGSYVYKEKIAYTIKLSNNGFFKFLKDKKEVQQGNYHYSNGKILIDIKDEFIKNVTTIDYDEKKKCMTIHTIERKLYKFRYKR